MKSRNKLLTTKKSGKQDASFSPRLGCFDWATYTSYIWMFHGIFTLFLKYFSDSLFHWATALKFWEFMNTLCPWFWVYIAWRGMLVRSSIDREDDSSSKNLCVAFDIKTHIPFKKEIYCEVKEKTCIFNFVGILIFAGWSGLTSAIVQHQREVW